MYAIFTKLHAVLVYVPVSVRTFLIQLLTGKDNFTFDVSRVLLLLSGLTFLGLSIYHAVVHKIFDPTDFGVGAGSIIGGGCAGIAVKHKTEPDAPAAGEQ